MEINTSSVSNNKNVERKERESMRSIERIINHWEMVDRHGTVPDLCLYLEKSPSCPTLLCCKVPIHPSAAG